MELSKFENEIGYKFKNINLLKNALTHTSYANEKKVNSNEKLEFLGDAVLEIVISEYVFKNYINLKEGEMTKVRATVVCEDSLVEVAERHHFSDFLFLGHSEELSNGRNKHTIVADSVEAVIAAMFLDGGIETAKKFIIDNLKDAVEVASKNVGMKDYKTVLQEKLQQNGKVEIKYFTEEQEKNKLKKFFSKVSCDGKVLAQGEGKTKKLAEMDAAKNALDNYKK